MNDTSKNKRLYKLLIITAKYVPIIASILQIGILIVNYLGIAVPILTCLGGTSLTFLLLLYLIAEAFNFCSLYRTPIWYMLIVTFTNILRILGLLPIDLLDLYRLYGIITGVGIVSFIIAVYKNRNKPKVDSIKQFCDRYCNC